jgi:hypothetical protein
MAGVDPIVCNTYILSLTGRQSVAAKAGCHSREQAETSAKQLLIARSMPISQQADGSNVLNNTNK